MLEAVPDRDDFYWRRRAGGQVEVKIHHSPAKTICDIWTVPGALAEAEAEALDAFEETHYAPRRGPWKGGAVAIEFSDDEEEETSGAPDVVDAATPSSEQELTPEFLQAMFFAVSFVPVALKRGRSRRSRRSARKSRL